MRTPDMAVASFAAAENPGRIPTPQDAPPFGDLLSLLDDAARMPAGGTAHRMLEQPVPRVQDRPADAPDGPAALRLDHLLDRCARSDWGGETFSSRPETAHTAETDAERPGDVPATAAAAADLPTVRPEPASLPAPAAIAAVAVPALADVAGAGPAAEALKWPAAEALKWPAAKAHQWPATEADNLPAAAAPNVSAAAARDGPDAEASNGPAPMRLAVLRQETHFAPVRPFTGPAPVPPSVSAPGSLEGSPEGVPETALDAEDRVPLDRPGADRSALRAAAMPRAARSGGDDAGRGPGETAQGVAGRPLAPPAASEPAGAAPATGVDAPPPALPVPSLVQVGRAIAAEVAQIGPPGARSALDGPRTGPAPAGPVRVLDIALTPEALGRVVVHMRLTPHGLTVRLKADNPATAEMLAGDRDHLAAILRSAGLGDVDLEAGGSGLLPPDAPVRGLVPPQGGTGQEPSDPRQGAGGGAEGGRQGRNSRHDRTFPDEDAAPSFADEPRSGAS